MHTCDYCEIDLQIDTNWTTTRKNRNNFTCTKCASKIAMGKLSRSARVKREILTIEENFTLDENIIHRNNVEIYGATKANAIKIRREKIKSLIEKYEQSPQPDYRTIRLIS